MESTATTLSLTCSEMAGPARLAPGTGHRVEPGGGAATIKAKVETRLLPASAYLPEPLLRGHQTVLRQLKGGAGC